MNIPINKQMSAEFTLSSITAALCQLPPLTRDKLSDEMLDAFLVILLFAKLERANNQPKQQDTPKEVE
jgi:hypothetical protein